MRCCPDLRASTDRAALARALAAATDASIALGDYESAIQEAQEAFDVHQQLGQRADAAWDLNAVGLANLYLGRYDRALASYQRALALDRAGGDGDGEITRLNNIGNVHYMRGRYADALRLYQEAMAEVDTRTSERSRARLRKMTISNLAALHQRLGADERALDLYAQLADRRDDAAERRSAAPDQSGRAPPASRRSGQGDGDIPAGAGALRPRRSTATARSAPGATSASPTRWT